VGGVGGSSTRALLSVECGNDLADGILGDGAVVGHDGGPRRVAQRNDGNVVNANNGQIVGASIPSLHRPSSTARPVSSL
jgi:hypothetical protein